MTKVNSGMDIQSLQMAAVPSGDSGTSTSTGSTSLTDTGKNWTVNQFVGCTVAVGSVQGLVISNAGGAGTSGLVVDRWSPVTNPYSSSAASTPSNASAYTIVAASPPAIVIGLTTDTGAVVGTDTALTSEINHAGGGLNRKAGSVTHSPAATSYVVTSVFTANSSDSIPGGGYAIAKIGVFQSMVANRMVFETPLASTATIGQSGDQLTISDTVTL